MMGIRRRLHVGARSVVVGVVVSVVVGMTPAAHATPPAKPALKTWGATGAVRAEVIIGTTLYIGGSFTSVISPDGLTTANRRHLAAIDLTTGDLLPWAPTTNGAVLAMATDGTGLFIGGSFSVVNGVAQAHLAAVDLAGAALAWAAGGNATVSALHLNGTTLYVGGAFTTLGGAPRGYLGATTTSGELLPWDPSANDRVRAITTLASGEVVVGGFFTQVGGQAIDHIDGLDPITGASLSWSYPSSAEVVGLITGPDDNVYGAIAGSGGKVRSWTNDGHLRWTVYTDGDVNAVAYYGGQVIAGGHWIYLDSGATYLPRLAAFDPATGAADTAWRPRLNKQVWAFATDGGPTLAVGGVFTAVGGSTYRRVAVYRT
jgi:hypothetical protein